MVVLAGWLAVAVLLILKIEALKYSHRTTSQENGLTAIFDAECVVV